ncbi:metallophosphoesterase family protein [Pseudorhodoferax sp. Leaf267]|uniref:metallophosphoesterase family protein n=1 Tax=Pseudorhodoferax sp. Leaf267 TaxID=1736316 RepID=UPI0006FDE9EE|nr:metallophosphoesterase family protein [Pseudorhodoferax sp. Leaf267]KQP12778.1 phosphodiesterase [Pseudorhodoferax sp. Leaf267]
MPRIGLLSDTHGLLRPEALAFLRGSDAIVHAGDICDPAILEQLAAIAPVTAVRGNNDHGPWAERLPHTAHVQFGAVRLCVVHDLGELAPQASADAQVVVSGHSHKPVAETRGGVLYVNPGSCGPRRFKLPIAVAELLVDGSAVSARIFTL